jgi:5'-nucleotidase
MKLTMKLLALVMLGLGVSTSPCQALDILVTNDDGFEASMIHALYQRLKQSGNRVLVSAPAMNGTAMGGALPVAPIGPLLLPSRSAHIRAGAPGVGSLPKDPDVFYVNSTPAVSLLHGLDVAAKRRWGKPPDLVISGPNYGNNMGLLTTHSGTFNAAMTALNRGVPSIAVSAGALLDGYRPFEALRAGDKEYEIADVVVRLVEELVRTRKDASTPLLPPGIGLNVNLPEFFRGTGARLPFKFSKVGTAVFATPVFVENLATDPVMALTFPPPLPGISAHLQGLSPGKIGQIHDKDPSSEQNIVNSGAIAVSVVQSTHQADVVMTESIRAQLLGLTQPSAH